MFDKVLLGGTLEKYVFDLVIYTPSIRISPVNETFHISIFQLQQISMMSPVFDSTDGLQLKKYSRNLAFLQNIRLRIQNVANGMSSQAFSDYYSFFFERKKEKIFSIQKTTSFYCVHRSSLALHT